MMRNICLAPLFFVLTGIPARAQDIKQSEIELYEQSADGHPAVCGVQFTFAFRDNVYGANPLGGTTGSISYAVASNGSIATMFKVVAVSGSSQAQVHSASIKAKNEILHPKHLECQDTRNFCGSFFNADTGKIVSAMSSDQIEIRYNLQAGGLDYALPVSIYKAKNLSELDEFKNCILALVALLPD